MERWAGVFLMTIVPRCVGTEKGNGPYVRSDQIGPLVRDGLTEAQTVVVDHAKYFEGTNELVELSLGDMEHADGSGGAHGEGEEVRLDFFSNTPPFVG
jgi:hypothetical protein